MSSEVWLPVATLVLGILLGYVADWLREKRTTERERQERWKAFQRETILEAQELAGNLYRVYVRLLELFTEHPNKARHDTWLARFEPLDDESRVALTRMSLIISRISDEPLSKALEEVLISSILLKSAEDGREQAAVSRVGDAIQVVDKRVKELLPDLY